MIETKSHDDAWNKGWIELCLPLAGLWGRCRAEARRYKGNIRERLPWFPTRAERLHSVLAHRFRPTLFANQRDKLARVEIAHRQPVSIL